MNGNLSLNSYENAEFRVVSFILYRRNQFVNRIPPRSLFMLQLASDAEALFVGNVKRFFTQQN